MILLDTNVLSEFMRPQPAVGVVAWLDKQPSVEVFTNVPQDIRQLHCRAEPFSSGQCLW